MVDAQLGGQRADHLGESTAHDRGLVAEPFQRPHEGARPRGQEERCTDPVQGGLVEPGQEPDSLSERILEIDLPRHGRLGHLGHLRAASALLGQQVDDLTLEERRIGIEDDQMLGPAMEAVHLDRDVDFPLYRLIGQCPPEQVEIASRHGEFVAVHGIGGQPHDALDVPVTARDATANALQGRRRDLGGQYGDEKPVTFCRVLGLEQGIDRHAHGVCAEPIGDGGAQRGGL
jgi:hypothetical protein